MYLSTEDTSYFSRAWQAHSQPGQPYDGEYRAPAAEKGTPNVRPLTNQDVKVQLQHPQNTFPKTKQKIENQKQSR